MYCIYHSRDIDGWMSAAIVKKFYDENRYCSVCGHTLPKDWAGSTPCCGGMTLSNRVEFIGWDYGNLLPGLLKKEKVIMVDISFPKDIMLTLHKENSLVWIDHHVSAIKDNTEINVGEVIYEGLTDTKFAACELTWKYFFPNEPMPEPVRLLGRYDCFGHKGTKEEMEVLWYQYYARTFFKSPDDCMRLIDGDNIDASMSIGRSIYRYLCSEAETDYKNIFEWDYNGLRIACINRMRFNPINFGIAYHNDGYDAFLCFHYANKKWNFSLYNDNGRVDCSVICRQFGGGGHAGASGFVSDNLEFLFK